MGKLSKIINEIERHKGVLSPNPREMSLFFYEVYVGAHEKLGHNYKQYADKVEPFILEKYKMIQEHVIDAYWKYPNAREFAYAADWEDLETAQELYIADMKK